MSDDATDPGGHGVALQALEEYRPIAGAPPWFQEGDRRAYERACIAQANLELLSGQTHILASRIGQLEARVAELEKRDAPTET